jgi:hypothetical protein
MYYSNPDVVVATIDYDVVPTTNNKYVVEEVHRWTSFFYVDATKYDNVNKSGHRANKHAQVLVKYFE